MKRTYFYYSYGDEKIIFVTEPNAQGMYIPERGSILGTMYDCAGRHMQTTRVAWSDLTPMNYGEIVKVFPSANFNF